MNIQWMEVMRESRGFSISDTSVAKQFSFIIQSDDFLNFAQTQAFPGDPNLILWFDDEVMQKQIIPLFRSMTPLTYNFAVSPDQSIILYCVDLKAEQLNWRTWKIDVTYDLPPDNGQSRGGGGGDTGPADKEDLSKEFTQLSFDSSIDYENSQIGILLEAQNATGNTDDGPYTIGETRRVGETDDGIKGFDVPVRKFTFEITQYMSPTKMTYAYMRRIAKLTTTLNSKDFFGFAPLSCMCLGAGASGHLYQNIPVGFKFEFKPNVKFVTTLPATLQNVEVAPINETFTTFPNGTRKANTIKQYDKVKNPLFPDTASSIWQTIGLAIEPGVHSGWAHVEYEYKEVINVGAKHLLRQPSVRKIFMPPRIGFFDFVEFLL